MSISTSDSPEPSGFTFIRAHIEGERSGEALVEAPDGTLCHVIWDTADDIHFEAVEPSAASGVMPPPDELVEFVNNLSPEEKKRAEYRSKALRHDPIYDSLPDIGVQWEAWRAAQGF
jgi:hypothetical protein